MMSEQGDFESLRVALLSMIERGDERIEYLASLLAPVTR